jgi:NADH-quinone oxidoreductase subunit D/NADH-quinone oxidoreductase subunit C/D
MDLGGLTCYFYGLRDREKILDIFEESCGSRLLHSYYCPGGLMKDIHPNFQQSVKDFIKYFRKKLPEYDKFLTGNVIFRERTKNVGFITKEEAINYGFTGPSGRGSGWSCDVRKHHPYAAYDKVEFTEPLYHEGDTYARYKVRMDEMWESMRIIEQLIDNIPSGDYVAKMKAILKLPEGEYMQRVEAAKGEFSVFIISKGDKTPYRMKFRSPSFSNLSAIDHISRGFKIADLVAISGSLDLVIPDIDR